MTGVHGRRSLAWTASALLIVPAQAAEQTPADRADPSVVEQELRQPSEAPVAPLARDKVRVDPVDPAAAISRPVQVNAIEVEGATELPASLFAEAAAPFVGRTLGAAELRQLASAVAGAARARGYGLATAWIPEQLVEGGILRVAVDEGRVDEIRATGKAAALVNRSLAVLVNGRPVRTAVLERQLMLAGDLPGVSIGKARLERIGGRNVLRLKTDSARSAGRAFLDNWGTGSVGPVRGHVSVEMNGLLADDDTLAIGGVSTLLEPTEFGLVRFAYAKLLDNSGTGIKVSGYGARSRPDYSFSDEDFDGQSIEGSLAVEHPILRSRRTNLWGEIEFSLRDSEQSRNDIKTRDDRLAVLKAGSYLSARLAGGRARARLSISRGLGLFDPTREADFLKSRRDGSAVFSKAEFWAHYDRTLGGPFSVQVQAEGQLASRPLLSSEEMGLGGRYFLRGYDYREFSGDRGIAGSVELRLDLDEVGKPFAALQPYVYADAGSVDNLRNGSGGGSLASAGGGLRFWVDPRIEAGIELGVPLSAGEDGDTPDPRFSFVAGLRF